MESKTLAHDGAYDVVGMSKVPFYTEKCVDQQNSHELALGGSWNVSH